MSKTLLITGATGKQGGSVIDALLAQEADFEILALTRNGNSGSAQKLVEKSPQVKLVEGTLDEPDVIFRNAKNVTAQPIWGVFSVQPIGGSKHEVEEKQGKDLVDAALKNNVQLFVYTSVDRGGDASFDNPTNIPHFITKHNIEHHLIQKTANAGNSMSWTILRPTAFFDNFTPDFFGKVFATCWKVALKEKPLQLISVRDIGYFGAQAFLNPDEYKGTCVSLAGDDLTFDEMARRFKEKTGNDVPLTFEFLARIMLWFVQDFGLMFKWFNEGGYAADIQKLRRVDPDLKDFRGWLERESGFDVKGK